MTFRDDYANRWLSGDQRLGPILGPPIPPGTCERCGCCSTRNGLCIGVCTECGHHLIDDCPRCEEKDREVLELRRFIESIVDGAKGLHIY